MKNGDENAQAPRPHVQIRAVLELLLLEVSEARDQLFADLSILGRTSAVWNSNYR